MNVMHAVTAPEVKASLKESFYNDYKNIDRYFSWNRELRALRQNQQKLLPLISALPVL